jgi:DNA (cytosine-5)-methyltransferase 1
MWPVRWKRPHLLDFLEHPTSPLSARASAGFLSRAERGNLRMPEAFIEDVRSHLLQMKDERAALAA